MPRLSVSPIKSPRQQLAPELYPRQQLSPAMDVQVETFEEKYLTIEALGLSPSERHFEHVFIFPKRLLESLHESRGARTASGHGEHFRHVAISDPAIQPYVEILTTVANDPEKTEEKRREYRDALLSIYRKLPLPSPADLQDPNVLFVGVVREGAALARLLGYQPTGRTITPHLKRIPFDGGLLVAVRDARVERSYDKAIVFDGAIASGATLVSLMMLLREQVQRFEVYSAHATEQSIRAMERFAEHMELDIQLVIGHVSGRLDDHFYALEKQRLVVGDLGDTIPDCPQPQPQRHG